MAKKKVSEDYRCWHPVLIRMKRWGNNPNKGLWYCTNCERKERA